MSELKPLQESQEPLSITQLSLRIKNTVEGHFSFVKIRGEVSGFKKHTSGHCYFALKDSDSVIDAVCWRGTPKTDLLKDGAEIIATGKVTTYPGRSKYQIVVQTIEPSGQGALLLLLQQLKEKILKEGLFDEKHKKPLPLFPKKIGLITSPTGAVLRDILHRLNDRYPCNVLLWPVLVQGEGSALQVTKAIEGMNQLNDSNRPDILIIARGGGSFEDLFAFNDEQLIRAAFASKIPIISAIGHETDVTLLDFVADKRAPTPTGAAEIATPVISQVFLRLEELQLRLKQIFLKLVDYKSILLKRFDHAFDDPKNVIREKGQYLDDWDERRLLSMSRLIVQKRLILGKQTLRSPLNILTQQKEKLLYACDLLSKQIKSIVTEKQAALILLSRTMEAISYKRTLDRGFAIVKNNKGHILDSIEMVQKEPQLSLSLKDGDVMVTPKKEIKQGSLF